MSEFDCSGLLAASCRFLFRTEGLIIQSWECCYRLSSGIFSRVCPLLKRVAMPKLMPPSTGKPTCSNCSCEAVNLPILPIARELQWVSSASELPAWSPSIHGMSLKLWFASCHTLFSSFSQELLKPRILSCKFAALQSTRSRTCNGLYQDGFKKVEATVWCWSWMAWHRHYPLGHEDLITGSTWPWESLPDGSTVVQLSLVVNWDWMPIEQNTLVDVIKNTVEKVIIIT